jgi:hypothetical protein
MDAHNSLQESPGEPGCDLPRVVIALMVWSDSTQLTNFGNAKLWPLYMFFGNESKYRRGKPSCHLCEHVAYFETVCIVLTLSFVLMCNYPAAGFLQRLRHHACGQEEEAEAGAHRPLSS